jgi:hypothetical protein
MHGLQVDPVNWVFHANSRDWLFPLYWQASDLMLLMMMNALNE